MKHSIRVYVFNKDGSLYEMHEYVRPEGNATTAFFWDLANRYGTDSFFNDFKVTVSETAGSRLVQTLEMNKY